MDKPPKAGYRIALSAVTAGLALAVAAVLLPAGSLVLANTSWGRQAIERLTARLSGGEIRITGLAGHVPDDLRADRLELRDGQGLWLAANDVHVQWSPAQLLHEAIHLELVEAASVQFARLPRAHAPPRDGASAGPPRIDIERIALPRVDIGAPLAGAPATVSIQGSLGIDWPREGNADLRVLRTDAPGTYQLQARVDASTVQADLAVEEPAHGLLAGLADLADLGAVSAQLHLQGARAAPALRASLAAGALRATAAGSIDGNAQTWSLDLTGSAPAMTPRPDLHWQGVTLQAHVHGPFRSPDAVGQLRIEGLSAAGAQARSLRADVQGNGGSVALHAVAERVRMPGPAPELLLAAPLDLRASMRLDDPARPTTFTLSHPLASVQGHAHAAAGGVQAELTATVPQLAPFSALAGTDLEGRTAFTVQVVNQGGATQIDVSGTMDVTGGSALVRGLAGSAAQFDAALALRPREVDILRARLDAGNLHASVSGTSAAGKMDLHWHAGIAQLAALTTALSGDVDLDGRLQQDPQPPGGVTGNTLRLQADVRGKLGTRGFENRPIEASVQLWGLPSAPLGHVEAHGTLGDAPLALAAALARQPSGDVQLRIERADWKSARLHGELVMGAGTALPPGHLQLEIAQLADLAPWVDPGLQGSAVATVELARAPAGPGRATLAADLSDLAVAGSRAEHVHVNATIDDPAGHASLTGEIGFDGLATSGFRGSARLGVKGPLQALGLALAADLHAPDQTPARLDASAVLDADARRLAVGTLQAQYGSSTLQLLAPAQFSFRDGIAVDRLRVGAAAFVLELAGAIEPRLDLTVSVRNAALPGKGAPAPGLKGSLAVDARLTGDLAHSAAIDAKISMGPQAQLVASGQLPFSADAPIGLHAKGTIDATLANAGLASTGRRLRGQVAVNMDVGGTWHAPQIRGTLRLADGEFADDNLGAHLTGIDALLNGSGASLQIDHLTAKAGPGTVSLTGAVGLLSSKLPIDLRLTAHNAQPLASDFVVANLDADIHLQGTVAEHLDAKGTIKVNRADVTIPNALPPSVGVLEVRRAGQAPPPAAAAATLVGWDLQIDAPGAVFVRGRGIDAEMGGSLTIAGTSAAPQISGGFDLRRGTFDLAGSTLTFVSGRVGFNGTGLNRKIDPTLDFEAQSQSTTFTAKLDVTGYADAPKISLSSTPDMPQDEILAQLLFGTSVNKLTTLQMVQIGSAVAAIGGLGSAGGGALSTVQKTLGLDRLSVGNTPTGATSVEAGRYVSKGVFVGARQMGTAGGTTQAIVQIDITRQLKAVGAFGTGGTVQGATPDNDPGNSIGLLYQIEY
jgi:translocation and assembly module TamB